MAVRVVRIQFVLWKNPRPRFAKRTLTTWYQVTLKLLRYCSNSNSNKNNRVFRIGTREAAGFVFDPRLDKVGASDDFGRDLLILFCFFIAPEASEAKDLVRRGNPKDMLFSVELRRIDSLLKSLSGAQWGYKKVQWYVPLRRKRDRSDIELAGTSTNMHSERRHDRHR